MKRLLFMTTCLSASLLNAASSTFSLDRLNTFYDNFMCEEKQVLSSAGLSSPCNFNPNNPFNPPPDPGPPPFHTGLLPIILVNNSGFPDSEVYVVLTGKTTDASSQVFVDVNTSTGIGTLHDVVIGDNSMTYSYALSSLPAASGGHVIYIPQMISGLVWISMVNKLSMPVIAGTPPPPSPPPAIVQPPFTDPNDPNHNYYTNYDIFEVAFNIPAPPAPQTPTVSADATAVSFFSLPLYGYLSTATSASQHTGLYQPRSYIMQQAAATLNTAPLPERTQWNNLFLTNNGTILRYLSTGKAMAASLFDANYLDNATTYGYSYINDIWNGANGTGPTSYYKNNHTLSLTVTVTNPSTATYNYSGTVNGANQFVFISNDGGPTITLSAPVIAPTPTGTTSYNIFSALQFTATAPTAGTAYDAVSKLVQEAMIAGLIPTTNTVSLTYLANNQANFYQVNPNLTAPGGTTGPWYDLYSKSLHAIGSIYTYGFDEPLWPQVLLNGPFVDGSTYLSITIGNAQ